MKTPEFWSRRGPVAMALTPLSLVWLAGSWMRRWRARPYEADIPVICIGNLTAGGSGKTPIVGWLYDRLAARGWNPAILSRGYGGTERGPIWVNGDQHDAAACGDEPLMLAEGREVMVAHDRAAGASRISAGGKHDVILMDDGMQNPNLKRDLTIGVFDGGSGIGNGLVMPAGPLRSRLRSGMAEIDLAIINGDDEAGIANLLPDGLPAFQARLLEDRATVESFNGTPLLAFAGIGRPARFFRSILSSGGNLVRQIAFADHHPYSQLDLARLQEDAHRHGADLITTHKDWIRLPADWRSTITMLPVTVDLDNDGGLLGFVEQHLETCRGKETHG